MRVDLSREQIYTSHLALPELVFRRFRSGSKTRRGMSVRGWRGKDSLCRNRKIRAKCQVGLWASKIAFSWNIDVDIQNCHTEDFHSAAAIPEGGRAS